MITDPGKLVITEDHDHVIIRGGGQLNSNHIIQSSCHNEYYPEFCNQVIGLRIVMNVIDFNKLMEINNDH